MNHKTAKEQLCVEDLRPTIVKLLEGQAQFDALEKVLAENGLDMNVDFGDTMFSAALDLLGVPPDNFVDEIVNQTGEIPDGAYSRDWAGDDWDKCRHDPNRFIESVLKSLRRERRSG